MKTLRIVLATLALALWAQLSWAVDISPGQGVSFKQVSYADDPLAAFTPVGLMRVDINALRFNTGIPAGFVNVATAQGWVLRNIPVFAEETYPYSGISSDFDLGVTLGTRVTQLTALVRYTADSVTSFGVSPSTSFEVSTMNQTIGGSAASAGGPVTPPTYTDVVFANPNDVKTVIQWDHPNIETAKNQCVPMSIANSLQFLHDSQGLSLPHEHKPGQNGDNSLVGQLDAAGARPVTDRQHGSGLRSLLTPKLKYLAQNNLAGRIVTTSYGGIFDDAPGAAGSSTVNGVTATSSSASNTVDFDKVMQALDEGQDCEMIYQWPTGAHAVDLVGAGRYKGQPWLMHASDLDQADAARPDSDNAGAGPQGMKFEYLGPPNAAGEYSFRGRTMKQVVCEKYVPPPVKETVTRTMDPAGHSCCIAPPPGTASVGIYSWYMTLSGNAPYFPMTGWLNANGSFSLASTATIAGFSNVTSTFVGSLSGNMVNGRISVGTGGQLPTGQAIAWDVTIDRGVMPADPSVRVNGFRHGYKAAARDELLRPMVSMKAGSQSGQNVDWWVLASTDGFYFHYDLATANWVPGIQATYTGPLFDLPVFALPYIRLPAGTYDIFFGYDTVPDGVYTTDAAKVDTVRFTVP